MHREIRGSVVVITGASSGIGRAAALAFARKGARVVLAARRGPALDEICGQCANVGGEALSVPADVSDERSVYRLADAAVERFGRIDTWVNNAAVTAFGRFDEIPMPEFRRVIETNLFGYVYGARAALRHFRSAGHGTLVNVSSIVGSVGQPFTSAYVVSKFAIRGLSEALQQEYAGHAGISVCTVLPGSTDTPLFQHAANYSGRAVKAMEPVHAPEEVASVILELARHPRKEVYVGAETKAALAARSMAPSRFDRAWRRRIESGHFTGAPAASGPGNLYEPMPQYAKVEGGWRKPASPSRRPRMAAACAITTATGVAGIVFLKAMRRRAERTPELFYA